MMDICEECISSFTHCLCEYDNNPVKIKDHITSLESENAELKSRGDELEAILKVEVNLGHELVIQLRAELTKLSEAYAYIDDPSYEAGIEDAKSTLLHWLNEHTPYSGEEKSDDH